MEDLNPDFRDLIESFTSHHVEFLVVGAYALAFLGHTRFTEDIDIWIRRIEDNSARTRAALPTSVYRSMTLPRDSSMRIGCCCSS